jgi:hypothetical protein
MWNEVNQGPAHNIVGVVKHAFVNVFQKKLPDRGMQQGSSIVFPSLVV